MTEGAVEFKGFLKLAHILYRQLDIALTKVARLKRAEPSANTESFIQKAL